jgi:endonuclease G
MQIPVELIQKSEKEYPLSKEDIALKEMEITTSSAIDLDGEKHFDKRKKMIAAASIEGTDEAFERYMGENDLISVNYLLLGYFKSRAVGRIRFFDKTEMKPGVATGFLISPDLVMTNYHVFFDMNNFKDTFIEFDYEYDVFGREKEKIVFELDPSKFFYNNKELDFAIIGIKSSDVSAKRTSREMGYLVLNGNTGKAGVGDFATIIQHPEGKLKQVALRENKILEVALPDIITYTSDTAQGSSGSPVLNDQWQLIALHSAGVAQKDEQGNYLDKDNQVIPVIKGKVDGSRVVWLSNRGIRVSSILNTLNKEQFTDPLIQFLFSPAYNDSRDLLPLSYPIEWNSQPINNEKMLIKEPVKTFIPAAENTIPPLQVTINIGSNGQVTASGLPQALNVSFAPDVLAMEKKLEDEIDFSGCTGFDEYFLGEKTPLPKPSASLKKKLAKLIDNPNVYVLKYHHYSSAQHTIRKMPVYSAINVNGSKRFRLDRGTDVWFRDRRIDFDAQLTDEFYEKSHMDKGHMSRREDAEWGSEKLIAAQAAIMTCSYTNACPQVPDLNRAIFGYKGLWGRLEMEILEKGVKKEDGDEAKICVYNGPFFAESDEVFKGIQIPVNFWKLIVWKNTAGKLRSTAFKLTQANLMGEVEFEKLAFDELFKEQSCSVKYIEDNTGLDFGILTKWDTFSGGNADEPEKLIIEDFEKMILDKAK